MPDWDEDSPRLRENLARVLDEIALAASQRRRLVVEMARKWQTLFMEGLDVAETRFVGAFRGESGIEDVYVRVGGNYGVAPENVAQELRDFEAKLQQAVASLDEALPEDGPMNEDQINAVIDLCSWAHAEWVRIHPFANGNGRTARLWANSIALRYGLPPFIRLRPRPDSGYGEAGADAMLGNWKPTAIVFHQMLDDFLIAVAGNESQNVM